MAQNNEETKKSEVAEAEEKILHFWKNNSIFEKTVDRPSSKGEFVFYDGPPFATGLPHYGHILGSFIKDTIPRYQTMQGKRVERRWGWDCHGLPIENIVEKDFKISGKKEIEKIGIDMFNEYARSKVLDYVAHWKETVDRIGRWVDFDGSYKTMDNSFIESVWWALSEMAKKDLLYEGTRVLPYCPRCETPIANSEIAMDNSYKDITDISVYVKFKLLDEPNTFLLVWTTTPWTLPGNTAAAVNATVAYLKIEEEKEGSTSCFFIAKDLYPKLKIKFENPKIIEEVIGKDLVGRRYQPPFDDFLDKDIPNKENGWKVYSASYVTTESGTGIVHLAPAYGEEDMELAKTHNIPFIRHVGPDGRFVIDVKDFAGEKAKPKEDHQAGDVLIIKKLSAKGLLFAKEKIIHSYPHCYRCETPLYYFALPSWFLKISAVKEQMLELNEKIHWIPGHLKEGRFKKSMEAAPDWNISRNRFWASPLPIWKCEKCAQVRIVSSIDDIKKETQKNSYFLMRHGEADHNVQSLLSSDPQNPHHLTIKGEEEVRLSGESLKEKGITKIIASDFIRCRESAKIIADILGFSLEDIVFEPRLREINFGDYNLRHREEQWAYFSTSEERFTRALPNGESFGDVKTRVGEWIYEFDASNKGEKVLIMTHEVPAWLLASVTYGWENRASLEQRKEKKGFLATGDIHDLRFAFVPHNKNFELDLHRPYIDEITFFCSCGGIQKRIPEVFDCWFESACMPFAQKHYPFENQEWFKIHFPAQFVAEYIAQTRTWFYYMHAVSTMLFDSPPFEHVVTTGTILALDGQKMSKSKGNYPDPWILFNKYGVDALRFYLLSSPLMKSEDINFSEKGVDEVYKRIILRLKNVVSFYETYRGEEHFGAHTQSEHVLDRWVLARLSELVNGMTTHMEAFEVDKVYILLDLFIDDLSTWYLRRSRSRLKSDDQMELQAALSTFHFTLETLSRVAAPFIPFLSEEIYQKLRAPLSMESVHLALWPQFERKSALDTELLANMETVRRLTSLALEARATLGVKIRQPLRSVTLQDESLRDNSDLVQIFLDEINVKDAFFDKDQDVPVLLDGTIDESLRREGDAREFIRSVQEARKEKSFVPKDIITIYAKTTEEGENALIIFTEEIKKVCNAENLHITLLEKSDASFYFEIDIARA